MTSFWTPTADLLHRPETTLEPDELSSITFLLAFFDEMDGVGRPSPEKAWARTARQIEQAARELDRIPSLDDGVPSRHIAWIAEQKTSLLNAFQRARLEAIPGWSW